MKQKQMICLVGLVSFSAGVVLDRIIFNASNTFGELLINKTNHKKDSYSIDIYDLDGLENKRRVILKVKKFNDK